MIYRNFCSYEGSQNAMKLIIIYIIFCVKGNIESYRRQNQAFSASLGTTSQTAAEVQGAHHKRTLVGSIL